MNARSSRSARSGTNTALAKSKGAKTARFLVHCRGRSARSHGGARPVTAFRPGSSGTSDAEVDEATFAHPSRIEDVPAIEDNGLLHQLLHSLEVRPAELVPLGQHEETVRLLQGLVRGLGVADPIAKVPLCDGRRDRVMGRDRGALPQEALEH